MILAVATRALTDHGGCSGLHSEYEQEDLILALWRDLGVTTLFVTHDIDEAVYLGQRVIVLSSSPTVIMEDLKIDLPAQRDQLTTRSLPRFGELRGHIYEQIQRAREAR